MGLKKRVMMPSAAAGIMGGAFTSENESMFVVAPDKLLIFAVVLVAAIKILHWIIG